MADPHVAANPTISATALLAAKNQEALLGGGQARIDAQHSKGKRKLSMRLKTRYRIEPEGVNNKGSQSLKEKWKIF